MGCERPSWANGAGEGHPHASGVTRQEALRIFDLLYRKAWRDMGGAATLGNTAAALCSAYEGSLIGGNAPHFWLEMLHDAVATGRPAARKGLPKDGGVFWR